MGRYMEFRVLGPVEVRRDGHRVAFSGAKLHTVLAALLLAREEVVSDERLCRLLWGWAPPATVSAQLYTYISRLRKILGDEVVIDRRPPGYAMSIGNATVDLNEFEKLALGGREALIKEDFERAGELLRDALARWNGQPFANATEYLADAEAPRLAEARAVTLEHRIAADLALGRHEQITGELTGLVAEFPLRERIRCQLMTALCRSGRQADAIHLYHHGRAVLADELGVNPGEELQATYRALLDGTLDRWPGAAPAVRAGARPRPSGPSAAAPAMLPPDTVDFTGRGPELDLVCRALTPDGQGAGRPRRVLVTGMAGLGKTALAVHAAHRCQRHFPDGQLYADLRAADGTPRHPARVLRRLLRALGPMDDVPAADDQDQLVRLYRERTRGRQLLIVLDNASGAAQLGPLLPNTPEPAVLVTGRTALPTVAGAHTVALAPWSRGTRWSCSPRRPAPPGWRPRPAPRPRSSSTAPVCRWRCGSSAPGSRPGRTAPRTGSPADWPIPPPGCGSCTRATWTCTPPCCRPGVRWSPRCGRCSRRWRRWGRSRSRPPRRRRRWTCRRPRPSGCWRRSPTRPCWRSAARTSGASPATCSTRSYGSSRSPWRRGGRRCPAARSAERSITGG